MNLVLGVCFGMRDDRAAGHAARRVSSSAEDGRGVTRRIAIALCLWIACSVAQSQSPFQFGVGIHVGQNRNELRETETALVQGGFNSFRDEVFWHRVETKQGVLEYPDNLRDLDQLVTRSVRRGVRPLLILNHGNRFYDGGGLLSSAEGIAAYSRYVRFVVKHFEGRVDQFEVWNEWNIAAGGTPAQRAARHGSPEDYARVLRAAFTAIKAANPTPRHWRCVCGLRLSLGRGVRAWGWARNARCVLGASVCVR